MQSDSRSPPRYGTQFPALGPAIRTGQLGNWVIGPPYSWYCVGIWGRANRKASQRPALHVLQPVLRLASRTERDASLAEKDKCLAQNNKSRHVSRATKRVTSRRHGRGHGTLVSHSTDVGCISEENTSEEASINRCDAPGREYGRRCAIIYRCKENTWRSVRFLWVRIKLGDMQISRELEGSISNPRVQKRPATDSAYLQSGNRVERRLPIGEAAPVKG
jgi:hypothetical protein